MAHLALPSQHEPFGQGVGEPAELQRAQGPHQVDTNRVQRTAARRCGCRGHGLVSSSGFAASTPPRMRVSWVGPVRAYSAGSRVNRPGREPGAPAAAGSTGCSRSIAFSSIEAIFDTDTTSRSRDRVQAVSTVRVRSVGPGRGAGRRCASGSRAAGHRAAARHRSRCSPPAPPAAIRSRSRNSWRPPRPNQPAASPRQKLTGNTKPDPQGGAKSEQHSGAKWGCHSHLHHAHVCQTTGDSIRLTQALAGHGVAPLGGPR